MQRPTLSSSLRRARAHLPEALDPLIAPLLHRAKHFVRDARGLAGLSSWIYSVHRGPLPHGGPAVSVHYLGRERLEGDALVPFRAHAQVDGWSREVLEEGGLVTFLAAQRDPTTTRGATAPVLLVDPLFDWIGREEERFRFPVFLRGMLPLAGSFDEQLERVRSKPYRRVLKRAHKQGVTWRISRDLDDLRDFHEALYEPLARRRFGPAAHVSPLEKLQRTLTDRGELLLVEEQGRPVIGSLLYRSASDPGTVFNWKYGIRDPAVLAPAALRERTAALEVALFEHAIGAGDRQVDFGLTLAVANDGIYVHKRRLGCDFTPLPHAPELLLHFQKGTQPAVLERVPMFVREGEGEGLRCLTGYTGARGQGGEPFTKGVLRECTFEGCAGASLFVEGSLDDVSEDASFPVEVTVFPDAGKGATARPQDAAAPLERDCRRERTVDV